MNTIIASNQNHQYPPQLQLNNNNKTDERPQDIINAIRNDLIQRNVVLPVNRQHKQILCTNESFVHYK